MMKTDPLFFEVQITYIIIHTYKSCINPIFQTLFKLLKLIYLGALSAAAVGGHVGVARAGVVVAESARRHAAATSTACAACPVA